MMITDYAPRYNVRYGTKENSLYNKLMIKFEEIENSCHPKLNVDAYESFVQERYDNDELTYDEYLELTANLEKFAGDEYISKCKRQDRKRLKTLLEKKSRNSNVR